MPTQAFVPGTTSGAAAQILVLDGSGSVRLALACPQREHDPAQGFGGRGHLGFVVPDVI